MFLCVVYVCVSKHVVCMCVYVCVDMCVSCFTFTSVCVYARFNVSVAVCCVIMCVLEDVC